MRLQTAQLKRMRILKEKLRDHNQRISNEELHLLTLEQCNKPRFPKYREYTQYGQTNTQDREERERRAEKLEKS